jgi:hypothetical protein
LLAVLVRRARPAYSRFFSSLLEIESLSCCGMVVPKFLHKYADLYRFENHGRPNRIFRTNSRLGAFVCSVLLCFLSSCCTFSKFSIIDTSQPGWKVQQGEAIWKPGKNYSELTGEIVLAWHEDGRSSVRFSKASFPIVAAQCTATNWVIEFSSQKLRFGGMGKPSSRFGWLQLPGALHQKTLPSNWHFEEKVNGGWRLENQNSGEILEGFLFQ